MSITDQQLETAETVCRQISDKANAMMHLAIIARDGSTDGIILTDDQKQDLIARYQNGKSELVELFNALP